jgi:hypothetical protein
MWVDMFLGEMFLERASNTLFWERIFWQTLGVALISTPKKYQLATRPSPTLALPPRQSAAHDFATFDP